MILDALTKLSAAQAVTVDAVSQNILDLGPMFGTERDLFAGEPLCLMLVTKVNADITTGDETYAVQLQTDDNEAFASPTTVFTQAIPAAQLVIGNLVVIPLPKIAKYERYLRLNYDTGGTTPSVTLDAYILPTAFVDKYKHYASSVKIS